jgi:hypothetical protein
MRKGSLSQHPGSDNPGGPGLDGQPAEGSDDAAEPGGISADDLDFDPDKLETEAPAPAPAAGRDLYDPEVLGLGQDFAAESGVAKKWDIVKVEKPSKSRVFRAHPTFRLKTTLLVLKEEGEVYLVRPELRAALAGEANCGVFALVACITKAGTPFLWPIKTADPDGKWNIWHQSAWQISEKARTSWCRMQANRDAGHYVADYDQRPAEQQLQPEWPDLTLSEWLRLAFQGSSIDSTDHPVLKRLRLED